MRKRLSISSRSTFFANRIERIVSPPLFLVTCAGSNEEQGTKYIHVRFPQQASGSSRVPNGQIHFANVLLSAFKFKGEAPAISAHLPAFATVERLNGSQKRREYRAHEPRITRYLKQQSEQQDTGHGVELRASRRIEGRVEEHVAEFIVELSPPATIQPWINVSTTFPVRGGQSRPINHDRRQAKDDTAEYTDRHFAIGFSPVASDKLHPDIDVESVPVRGSRLVPRPPVRYNSFLGNR